jgi:membrane protein implicated in regulation of membrane protease activity
VGRKVKVLNVLEPSQDKRKLLGRVLIDGEDWNAEIDGRIDVAPENGAELEVLTVDPSILEVTVK